MAGCSQYAAAFGYEFYIVAVSADSIDFANVTGGIGPGGFIDPTATVPSTTKIEEGATPDSIMAGTPGTNVVFNGGFNQTVFKTRGITNASLDSDTNTEESISYQEEGRGFDQSVAIGKSWNFTLDGITPAEDATYKTLRLLEKNGVPGQLKCKIARVGPTSTTEAIYGYATITNFTETVEAGGIVSWSIEFKGHGPIAIELDNTNSFIAQGPIRTLAITAGGSNLKDGTYPDIALTGGSGNGLATADFTISSGVASVVQLVNKGNGYELFDELSANLQGSDVTGLINGLSINSQGLGINESQPSGFFENMPITNGSGSGGTVSLTLANGIVTGVSVDDSGSGYVQGDIVTLLNELPGLPNPTYGEALSLSSLTVGNAYENTSYTNIAATGGSGSNLTFDITVSSGQVSLVTINNGGTGYVYGDIVSAYLNPQDQTVPVSEWSVVIETVDDTEILDATEPIFEVSSVFTGEGIHTDPTIRVTSILDSN